MRSVKSPAGTCTPSESAEPNLLGIPLPSGRRLTRSTGPACRLEWPRELEVIAGCLVMTPSVDWNGDVASIVEKRRHIIAVVSEHGVIGELAHRISVQAGANCVGELAIAERASEGIATPRQAELAGLPRRDGDQNGDRGVCSKGADKPVPAAGAHHDAHD